MSHKREVIGFKNGRLEVIARDGITLTCKCSCGVTFTSEYSSVMYGRTKSCGCLAKDTQRERMIRHGKSGTPEYNSWVGMRSRCYDKNHTSFARYGGRGITVCSEWIGSFSAFLRDMGAKPSPKHTLERKDNDKGYSPTNCRWATPKEQASNRAKTILEVGGVAKTVEEWAELLGIPKVTIYDRLRRYGAGRMEDVLRVGRCRRNSS